MLTKALSLILVMFLGLALGLETARYVHAQATGVGTVLTGTGAISMVNIHRALLGFSLLTTSGALLLSFRGRGGLGVGAWLSRQWLRFTTRLELTLDGLFDFDALNVGDGASALSESTRGLRLTKLYIQRFGQGSPSAVRQEMDAKHQEAVNLGRACGTSAGYGLNLQANAVGAMTRQRHVVACHCDTCSATRKISPHPQDCRICNPESPSCRILVKNRGTGGVIVRSSPPDEPSST